MTRSNSSDTGPRFLSDLIRDMAHLRQQQVGTEKRLDEATREHRQIARRLDAVESTLRAIGCRESDLAADIAAAEGRRQGQSRLLGALTGPVLLVVAWFLSLTWMAIQHSQLDEPRRRQQEMPPQMGPPVPERLRKP